MSFFRRNCGKIALLGIVVFCCLPFIVGNDKEKEFSPFASRSGMQYHSNPLATFANRISEFYGFNKIPNNIDIKSKKSPLSASAKRNSIKNILGENNSFDNNSINNQEYNEQVRSAIDRTSTSHNGTSDTKSNYKVANNSPVKGYVKINDKQYEVIEDIQGRRFVMTEKGAIPYEQVLAKTISKDDLMALRGKYPSAQDWELMQALQDPKGAEHYFANDSGNGASARSHRLGRGSAFGGNYGGSSGRDSDSGYKEQNIFADTYGDLQNARNSIDMPNINIASRGGSYGGNGGSGKDVNNGNNGNGTNGNAQNNNGVSNGDYANTSESDKGEGNNSKGSLSKELSRCSSYKPPKYEQVGAEDALSASYEKMENGKWFCTDNKCDTDGSFKFEETVDFNEVFRGWKTAGIKPEIFNDLNIIKSVNGKGNVSLGTNNNTIFDIALSQYADENRVSIKEYPDVNLEGMDRDAVFITSDQNVVKILEEEGFKQVFLVGNNNGEHLENLKNIYDGLKIYKQKIQLAQEQNKKIAKDLNSNI